MQLITINQIQLIERQSLVSRLFTDFNYSMRMKTKNFDWFYRIIDRQGILRKST